MTPVVGPCYGENIVLRTGDKILENDMEVYFLQCTGIKIDFTGAGVKVLRFRFARDYLGHCGNHGVS